MGEIKVLIRDTDKDSAEEVLTKFREASGEPGENEH
jgi:hypothetical protein